MQSGSGMAHGLRMHMPGKFEAVQQAVGVADCQCRYQVAVGGCPLMRGRRLAGQQAQPVNPPSSGRSRASAPSSRPTSLLLCQQPVMMICDRKKGGAAAVRRWHLVWHVSPLALPASRPAFSLLGSASPCWQQPAHVARPSFQPAHNHGQAPGNAAAHLGARPQRVAALAAVQLSICQLIQVHVIGVHVSGIHVLVLQAMPPTAQTAARRTL